MRRPEFNFDNMYRAFLTSWTFTLGGWSTLQQSIADHSEPLYNISDNEYSYYVIFIFIGVMFFGFYLSNLFVGIVFETYVRLKAIKHTGVRSRVKRTRLSWVKSTCVIGVAIRYAR